jgi:hypothetical protein
MQQGVFNAPSSFSQGPVGEGVGGGSPKQWSLGQAIIDTLSSGSYLTAGIGRKVGENVEAVSRGDAGGALDLFNPFSTLNAGVQGIGDRRTWSDNLKDWGVEEGSTGGVGPFQMNQREGLGLALDIALDPLWLIPGGAIIAGAKGVSKGAALASGASTAGVKLTNEAVGAARQATQGFARPLLTDNVTTGKEGVQINPAVQEFFPGTGQKIPLLSQQGLSNLVQGVRYSTADEYSRWAAARAEQRAAKQARKDPGNPNNDSVIDPDTFDQGPTGAGAALVKPAREFDESLPGETAAKQMEDVVEASPATRMSEDPLKDVDAGPKDVLDSLLFQRLNEEARNVVGTGKAGYMASRGITAPAADFKSVGPSEQAGRMADEYDAAVSKAEDPEVQAGYAALQREVDDQFDYMTNELGIKVEFVKKDPYNVKNAEGEDVPSSKLMMEDVLRNKRLQVRDSADDYAQYGAHPLLSVEANNRFRAVHDYFGHAGSGRGFLAGGEEAAWISHSQMFSQLARRAMTTETRGQNSWANKYGTDENGKIVRFAEQKAFLFPEEYVLAPAEYNALERRLTATNQFIGVKSNALQEYSDQLLEGLAMVWAPVKGAKLYSAVEIKQLSQQYEKLAAVGKFSPETPEVKTTVSLVDRLLGYLTTPSKYATVNEAIDLEGIASVTDLLRLGEDALGVLEPGKQATAQTALAMLRQVLDEPTDATDLLESALKLENRVITDPKPFTPTIWSVPAKEGVVSKPPFSKATFEKYFADDELMRDPEMMRMAFGETKFKPGSTGSVKASQRQQMIWEDFRARNHDYLAEVVEREKNDWFAANSIENSQVFTKMANGTVVGQGMLPAGLPVGAIWSLNGRPTTSLAALLDNLGSVIERRGPQVGGLPTTQITGGTRTAKQSVVTEIEGRAGGISTTAPVMRGEAIVLDDGARIGALEATGKIAAPARKEIITAIRKRGREIEVDRYPLALQAWMVNKLDGIKASMVKSGASDARLMDGALTTDKLANDLWESLPFLKSKADARKVAQLGPEAFALLSKEPARKFFIDAEFSREIGRPDESLISRQASQTGTRIDQKVVARDPESGLPIDKDGNVVPEKQAEVLGGTQYRVLAEGGSAYTGRLTARSGAQAAPQTGKGPQQLAGLQAIRTTVGSINEAITAKTLAASPEQARLLTDVLNTLQIRVAPNSSPQAVFKQFKEEALPRFEEIVTQIESAAKVESVAFHAKSVFRLADDQDISLMKAVEDYDVGELQRQSLKFTEDAMQVVDDACAAVTRGGPSRSGDTLLDQVLGGFSG